MVDQAAIDAAAIDAAADRELAHASLYFYARLAFLKHRRQRWQRNRHHEIVCSALEDVFYGRTKRLILTLPPRYSKTELAVVKFAGWALGRCPDAEFIHTSYASLLATKNSAETKADVDTDWYRDLFPGTTIAPDTAAKADWKTTAGGRFYAVGSGGSTTGFGAGKMREAGEPHRFGGAIIIDDPHKADEARSDVIRQSVIDWYHNTLQSRTNSPETPIILIMQRLHEADLAGHLLGGGSGEVWRHVNLPAIQDDGTALWPEKHSIERLRQMETAAPYMFAGQYQQMPAPLEGNIFKPGKMEIVGAVPAGTKFVRGWDFGGTEGGGDPTAGGKLGKMPDGRYIIADMARFQGAPETVRAELVNAAKRDGVATRIRIPQDPGQAGKFQARSFAKDLAGFTVSALPVTGDKITRAEPFAAQVNVGNVVILKAEWNDGLIAEMRHFPNAKHDDQVDALSDAFAELNRGAQGAFIAAPIVISGSRPSPGG